MQILTGIYRHCAFAMQIQYPSGQHFSWIYLAASNSAPEPNSNFSSRFRHWLVGSRRYHTQHCQSKIPRSSVQPLSKQSKTEPEGRYSSETNHHHKVKRSDQFTKPNKWLAHRKTCHKPRKMVGVSYELVPLHQACAFIYSRQARYC